MGLIAYVEINVETTIRCLCSPGMAIHDGDQCIVDVNKVLDFGRIVRLEDNDRCNCNNLPKVIRQATLQDQAKANENILMSKIARETCEARAEKYGLKLRLVSVRYSFDHKVLMVLFHSEERLDFREMVKELAGEFRIRVEMKQIGVRDEAGIIGGLGPCGRTLCCCSWLNSFDSINVKMAKVQRLSLNPVAISGMCGRLKCCLKYEYDQYRKADKLFPPDGAYVECPDGSGTIIDKNMIMKTVVLRMDDDRILTHKVSDVKVLKGKRRKKDENNSTERSES